MVNENGEVRISGGKVGRLREKLTRQCESEEAVNFISTPGTRGVRKLIGGGGGGWEGLEGTRRR